MTRTYTTIQSEMIDAICGRFYGGESGYVETVIEANPGLAALPAPLPPGTVIALPDIPRTSELVPVVGLWE